MKTAVEHIEALPYKLRMFGIPIGGPTNVFCDNEAVFKNTSIPDSTLKKKHTSICYHWAREAVAAHTMRVARKVLQPTWPISSQSHSWIRVGHSYWIGLHTDGSGFLPYLKVSQFLRLRVTLEWCWPTG